MTPFHAVLSLPAYSSSRLTPPALSVSPSNDVTITRLLQLLSPSPPPLPLMTRDIYLPTSMFGILEMMAERLQGAALFVAGVKGWAHHLAHVAPLTSSSDFHHLDDTLSRPLPPLPSSFSLPHLTSWLKKSGKSVASLPAINAPVVVRIRIEILKPICSFLLALIISSSQSAITKRRHYSRTPFISALDRLPTPHVILMLTS